MEKIKNLYKVVILGVIVFLLVLLIVYAIVSNPNERDMRHYIWTDIYYKKDEVACIMDKSENREEAHVLTGIEVQRSNYFVFSIFEVKCWHYCGPFMINNTPFRSERYLGVCGKTIFIKNISENGIR